jgi:hypothetical protein
VTLNGTSVSASGSLTVLPQTTTTYTLTAQNATGSTSSSATVTVSSGITSTTSSTVTTSGSRDPALWPFSTYSPWNYPIGSNATYATPQLATGATGITNIIFQSYVGSGVQLPVGLYIAQTTDPVRNVVMSCYFGCTTGIQSAYGTLTFPRHAPNNMSANTTDGELVLIAPDHLVAMDGDLWNGSGTGNISVGAGVLINLDLKGPGWNGAATTSGSPAPWPSIALNSGDEATPYPLSSPTPGSPFYSPGFYGSASGAPLLAGLLRRGEILNGIHHALAFSAPNGEKNKNAPGGHSWVWPATASDDPNNPTYPYGTTGNNYMGSLYAIPASVNLTSYTWSTTQGYNIALALQQYGAYNLDSSGTSGAQAINIRVSLDAAGDVPTSQAFLNDMIQAASLVKIVTNSFNTSTGGVPRTGYKIDGGDGTLLAPLAPPFGSQWGGGNGRTSYYVPQILRSLWSWLTRGALN